MSAIDWSSEIRSALKFHNEYHLSGEAVWKLYSGRSRAITTRNPSTKVHDTSVVWANVSILLPTLYYDPPVVKVRRRLMNGDPVSRLACSCAEELGNFYIESTDFHKLARAAVLDYLVPGRGVLWVEYDSEIGTTKTHLQLEEATGLYHNGSHYIDEYKEDADGPYLEQESLEYEEVRVAKPHWRDFLHSPARSWSEVQWVARAIYLSERDVKQTFGKSATKGLDFKSEDNVHGWGDYRATDAVPKAKIWEIWDREERKVHYCTEISGDPLESRDPMIAFKGFFPCAEPLQYTISEDSFVPVPDELHYDELHTALQTLIQRFTKLSSKVSYKGLFNKQFETSLQRLMSSDDDVWIPEQGFENALAKGGMEAMLMALPIEMISNVLGNVSQLIMQTKDMIYEISGVGDLMRSQSDPNKTATAVTSEDEHADLRTGDRQQQVQRWLRDTIRLLIEAGFERLSPETLSLVCGKQLEDPAYQQAMQLLQSDKLRTFAVEVETDSTIKKNQAKDKESAIEFGNLSREWALQVPTIPPPLLPFYAELLMFVVRRFEQGRELEEQLEGTLQQLIQQSQQPPPEVPPDPMIEIARQDVMVKQFDAETKRMKVEADIGKGQAELSLKQTELSHEIATGHEIGIG